MASPSGRSPANSATPGSPSGRPSSIPSPIPSPRPATAAPKLGPFQAVIDQILADDETAPPKQRHTAAQVFRRLRDEHGYPGGYAQVRRYRPQAPPPAPGDLHPPGPSPRPAARGRLRPHPRRLPRRPHGSSRSSSPPGPTPTPPSSWRCRSSAPRRSSKAWSPPSSSSVPSPKEVWWDNPKTVATLILQGRERQLHPRYAALASHYVFEPRFCMPARGNEKPDAESTVKAVQTPLRHPGAPRRRPRRVEHVLSQALRGRAAAGRAVALRPVHDQGPPRRGPRRGDAVAGAAVRPLRDPPGGRRSTSTRPSPSTATVTASRGRSRFGMVTVKGYVDRVVIVARRPGRRDARSDASAKQTMVLDPLHYLATLGRKPGALDHAPVFRDWQLPACFAAFRAELERQHGAWPARGDSCGSCNCWASIPLSRVSRGDRSLSARAPRQRRGRHPADAVAGRDRGRDGAMPRRRRPTPPRPRRSTSRCPT